MLILRETLDHWSVAVHTVAVNFIHFQIYFYVKLATFCTVLHLSKFLFVFDIMYYDNGCLLFTTAKWVSLLVDIIVPEDALNLVFLSLCSD